MRSYAPSAPAASISAPPSLLNKIFVPQSGSAGLCIWSKLYTAEEIHLLAPTTLASAWEDDKTAFILDTLEAYNVKATFFLCGFWAEKYPDKVKEIADAGHVIGNHSATHPHMAGMSREKIAKELTAFDDLLEDITGTRSTLFRAPYGEYDDNLILTAREMGYEIIQWNLDTQDWREGRSTQTILEGVLPKLVPGSIILCHNNGYEIENYLPVLLESAIAEGYRFVTVDALLLSGDTIIDVNGVQKQA